MLEINCAATELALYVKTREALQSFARQHPEEEFSFFAYRADYCYGRIDLCLDTLSNALRKGKEHAERIRATRKMLFDRPGGRDRARYFVARHSDRVIDFSYTSALFQYAAVS